MGFTARTIHVLIYLLYPVVVASQWLTRLISRKKDGETTVSREEVAATAPESMTLKEFYKNNEFKHFSRIPVYLDDEDFLTGYVLRSDVLTQLTEDHTETKLADLKRKIFLVNENMSVADVWDSLLRNKEQLAGIIDEYGSFKGIITLEDIIETIFGLEIIDEKDAVIDMQQYARERWQLRQQNRKEINWGE